MGFLTNCKTEIGKTSKVVYNRIFIAKMFLKMDEKTYIFKGVSKWSSTF